MRISSASEDIQHGEPKNIMLLLDQSIYCYFFFGNFKKIHRVDFRENPRSIILSYQNDEIVWRKICGNSLTKRKTFCYWNISKLNLRTLESNNVDLFLSQRFFGLVRTVNLDLLPYFFEGKS